MNKKIQNFLFPSASPDSLGLFRFFFYIIVFFGYANQPYFLSWQNVPLELWYDDGLTSLMKPVFLSFNHDFVFRIWQVSLIFSAFGLFTRYATIMAFICSFLLIGYAQSFGYLTRQFMPFLWVLFFMIFSKSGDGFSIDQKFLSIRKNAQSIGDSPEYGWPIVFVKIVFCIVFFQAGITKLIYSGIEWFDGVSLQNRMLFAYVWPFNFENRLSYEFHKFLFENLWVSILGASFTLILELSSPIALFSKKLKPPIILGLAILQVIIRFTIFVSFFIYIGLYIVWLPWGKIAEKLGKLTR